MTRKQAHESATRLRQSTRDDLSGRVVKTNQGLGRSAQYAVETIVDGLITGSESSYEALHDLIKEYSEAWGLD